MDCLRLAYTALQAAVFAFGFLDVPSAHARNGQCVWEEGPGVAGGHLYCKAEDCAGQGGIAQCTTPEGAPAAPYKDGDLGPDNWSYNVCDDTGIFLSHLRMWCEVGGGTPTPSECIGLAEGYLLGDPTRLDNEEMSVAASDAWIARRFATCPPVGVTDTGWGISIPTGESLCSTGGTEYKSGILTRQLRRRIYDLAEPCSTFTITMSMLRDVKCPAGYRSRMSGGSLQCFKPVDAICPDGNPVSSFNGTKLQTEVDYRPNGDTGLELVRRYNSAGYYRPAGFTTTTPVLPHAVQPTDYWRHTYDRRLLLVTGGTGLSALAQRHDGTVRIFDGLGSEIDNRDGAGAKLQALAGGKWKLQLADRSEEVYDSLGRLQSITSPSAQVTSLTYDTNGFLNTVVGPFGHILQFRYDAAGRLESVTLPGNGVVQYGYDRHDRLRSVTYPDNTAKQYHYESPHGSELLTGITDENAQRFSTYVYDASRRATLSEHAGGADRYEFTYGATTTDVKDASGIVRQMSFADAAGVYKSASSTAPGGSCGTTKLTTYDAEGNVSSRTDFNDNQTHYTFDPVRNLETSRTEAFGTPRARTITTEWHLSLRLPVQIDEPGRRTTFTYDTVGNLLTRSITDLATNQTRTWTHTYNTRGQVLTFDGPRSDVNDVTTYTYHECSYGAECGQIATITNAVGHVTSYLSYNAHGQPLSITDPNNVFTNLAYDTRQRLISRDHGGEITTFSYHPTGLLKRVTLPDESYLEYTYDAAHRLTDIEDGEGNRISYTLNVAGSRTIESVYDPSQVLARTRGWVYDTLDRVLSEVDATNHSVAYTYDLNGNVETVVDQEFRPTTQSYDELNRLKSQLDPSGGLVEYAYNARDELTAVRDPRSLTTTYEYNGFGELTMLTSPDTGVTQYTRDAVGNIDQSTDARGSVGDYTFDALGRVKRISYTDQTIQFTYDDGLYGKGKLTQLTDASGSTQWTYTAQGRVASKQQIAGSMTLTTSYSYDSAGRLSQITTPSGQVLGYTYSNGRPSSMTINGNALLYDILYAPFGPTRGWRWGNGTLAVREYDADGRLQTIDSAGLSTYEFYPDGKIRSWTSDTAAPPDTAAGLTTFDVDETSNRILSSEGADERAYSYDDAGNTTGDGARSFTYNAAGRMVSATSNGVTASYAVNGLAQRVRKTVAGQRTHFVYDEVGRLIGEYDSSGNLIQETLWFEDIPVATLRPNGSGGIIVFYVHADHLNTPRRVSRPSDNAVVWRWDSDPFGASAANEDSDGDTVPFVYNLRFPGQYVDVETGLHYNYYRDGYDSTTGRYTQSDPIGLIGGINTYSYVSGSPITLVDPLGLAECRYSISRHTLECRSSRPRPRGRRPSFSLGGEGVFSGRGQCQNDPSDECQESRNEGPVPEGRYRLNRHESRDDFWRLESIPPVAGWQYKLGLKRNGFMLHPGGFSLGCITVDSRNEELMRSYGDINSLLHSEDGRNTLEVVP